MNNYPIVVIHGIVPEVSFMPVVDTQHTVPKALQKTVLHTVCIACLACGTIENRLPWFHNHRHHVDTNV